MTTPYSMAVLDAQLAAVFAPDGVDVPGMSEEEATTAHAEFARVGSGQVVCAAGHDVKLDEVCTHGCSHPACADCPGRPGI